MRNTVKNTVSMMPETNCKNKVYRLVNRWVRLIAPAVFLCLFSVAVSAAETSRTLRTDHFSIEYPAAGKPYAELVGDIAESGYKRVAEMLDYEPDGPVRLVISGTAEDFKRLTNGVLPDWSSAAARPPRTIVLSPLSGGKMGIEHIIPHEIMHVFLYDASEGAFVPRWFHEGLAELVSGRGGIRSRWRLTWKSMHGGLLSFEDIQRIFSGDADAAALAYDQSEIAVRILTEMHGGAVYAGIVDRLAAGDSFGQAFETATGVSVSRYETHYLNEIRKRYTARQLLSYIPGTWTAIMVLALVAWVATKLRSRRIMKRWETEERPGNVIDFDHFPPDED